MGAAERRLAALGIQIAEMTEQVRFLVTRGVREEARFAAGYDAGEKAAGEAVPLRAAAASRGVKPRSTWPPYLRAAEGPVS